MAKERFFNLPVLILIASSFMLGMSEFIVVGILPDIAADLKISEVTVGNLVSLFAFVYAPVTPLGSGAVGTVPAIRHASDADRHIPRRQPPVRVRAQLRGAGGWRAS